MFYLIYRDEDGLEVMGFVTEPDSDRPAAFHGPQEARMAVRGHPLEYRSEVLEIP